MTKTLLNLGSGHRSVLDACEGAPWVPDWTETRVDIDPRCQPDIVASLTELGQVLPDDCADIILCSHVLEHFYDHQIDAVLAQLERLVRPDGAVIIKTPDLIQVAEALLQDDLERTLYSAPAGDIAVLDVLFGHRESIARGDGYMAHHTGFTETALAHRLLDAGFAEVATERGQSYDFIAIAYHGTRPYAEVLDRLRHKC